MNPRPKLSPAEFEIMQAVWSLGEATINDVTARINQDRSVPVKRATIQVQLRRLESKKWLKHIQSDRTFYYSALSGREEASAELADDIRRRIFDGSCADLVRCLFQHEKISSAEINELKTLVRKMDEH